MLPLLRRPSPNSLKQAPSFELQASLRFNVQGCPLSLSFSHIPTYSCILRLSVATLKPHEKFPSRALAIESQYSLLGRRRLLMPTMVTNESSDR